MEYIRATIHTIDSEEETRRELIRNLTNDYYIETTQNSDSNYITIELKRSTYYNNIKSILREARITYITTEEQDNIHNVENNIIAVCEDCGEYIYSGDEWHEIDGGDYKICDECYCDHYIQCDHCGEIIHEDDARYTDDDAALCEDCYSNHTTYCECCERSYYRSEIWITENGATICDECHDEHYCECEECNATIAIEDAYSDDNGDYYCERCWNERNDEDEDGAVHSAQLQGYHDHTRDYAHTLKTSSSDNLDEKIGIELETEQGRSSTSRSDYCAKIDSEINCNERHVHFERDGSLDNGVEIITEPMTLEYWNAQKDGIWKQLLNICNSMGYQSHNGGHCGLHVHFSKTFFGTTTSEQQQKLDTLLLFFENYKDEIIKLSRRESFGYCEILSNTSYDLRSIGDAKLRDKIRQSRGFIDYQKTRTGHSDAVNINASTGKTFEIRIMRGTLKHETFAACIEFIVNLIKCIQNEDAKNISFSKVVNYLPTKYLKQYIKEREIKANYKRLKDYTDKMQQLQQDIDNKVKRQAATIARDLQRELRKRSAILKSLEPKKIIEETSNNDYGYINNMKRQIENIQTLAAAIKRINEQRYYDAKEAFYNYYNDAVNNCSDTLAKINKLEDYSKITTLLNY